MYSRKLISLILLLSTLSCDACWFQGRAKSVNKILDWTKKGGMNIDRGISKAQLQSAISTLPSAIAWAIHKAGGVNDIMKRCDLDGDGIIFAEELIQESDCMNACWKQIAVTTFM